MNKEIFKNGKIQILYDDDIEEISFGFYPETFTIYERFLLARAFDLAEGEYD